MSEFQLSRIRFKWRGIWQGGADYSVDDIVEYAGSVYVAKRVHASADFENDLAGTDTTPATPKWELISSGVSWLGDWTISTRYAVGNIVKYGSAIYKCVESHTGADTLAEGLVADITKWTLVAVSDTDWKGNWTPNTLYKRNDLVRYHGRVYKALNQHTSAVDEAQGLEANQSDWAVIADSASWKATWSIGTRYQVNDLVKYGGITYKCITAHTSADNDDIGLEQDIAKWTILVEGIDYKGTWTGGTKYKKNDVVKRGPNLEICLEGHVADFTFRVDQAAGKWQIYIPGTEYENIWSDQESYQPGDIVRYGGYTYKALTYNQNTTPSDNENDWNLSFEGYRFRGDWNLTSNNEVQSIAYRTGDVIRLSGGLYLATEDNTDKQPDVETSVWEKLVDGRQFRDSWQDHTAYYTGDIVTWQGTAYICINPHVATESASRPDIDINVPDQDYWKIMIQGNKTNKLAVIGDLKTFEDQDSTDVDTQRLGIGVNGQALRVTDVMPSWDSLDLSENVYYVSPNGIDDEAGGGSKNAPFRTVRFAMTYLLRDEANRVGTGATVAVATGTYREILPISIPSNVALVGDELRSTTIQPAVPGDIVLTEKTYDNPVQEQLSIPNDNNTRDMFYVRNGCGIRRCTLRGLTGTLGEANDIGTQRPTGGAFVSLDPGAGPDDTSVWVSSKSTYVQGVTCIGDNCVGCKIDGSLHNGGNRSIVANDFTQVLSDGIGYWATNNGRSELVSVFTYYNHIGYLAENGGVLRATNGNNSYGKFGSVAEGFDANETPLSAQVNNKSKQAQINSTFTNLSEVLAIGYSNAGQDYTTATNSIVSAGTDLDARWEEFRKSAISNIKLDKPDDSTVIGGSGYKFITNFAQGGGLFTITLAGATTQTPAQLIGMRIVIVSGPGAGQYGYIQDYNELTKVAQIYRDDTNQPGWQNIVPGKLNTVQLNETTVYEIEPRVVIDEPNWNIGTGTGYLGVQDIGFSEELGLFFKAQSGTDNFYTSADGGATWTLTETGIADAWSVLTKNGPLLMAVAPGSATGVYSNDGETWDTFQLPTAGNWSNITIGGETGNTVMISATGTDKIYRGEITTQGDSTTAPSSWTELTLSASKDWAGVAYGQGRWVVIADDGVLNHSTNNGGTWTAGSAVVPFGAEGYNGILFGNNCWVAPGKNTDRIFYSANGVNWSDSEILRDSTVQNWKVGYSQGAFVAVSNNGNTATSYDGWYWKTREDTLNPNAIVGGYSANTPTWITTTTTAETNRITGGAQAFARVEVDGGSIARFEMFEVGSGYGVFPTLTVTDPDETIEPTFTINVNNGVLPQPIFYDRGRGYITAETHTISGDGFAEIYQTGNVMILKNLTREPGPGANVVFDNDPTIYRVVKVVSISGSEPNLDATIQITPVLTVGTAPDHDVNVTIRERFSQVRLTGHDFLDIGTGNFNDTNYPELYVFGRSSVNETRPANEVVEADGGRVFYTATDQDGNFRVGELFRVGQAQGSVTLNADFFDLEGLDEIRLGGIQVGGTQAIIREFSTDKSFVANSDNIVPTQRALKDYIESRFTGGGSNLFTNSLQAGVVKLINNDITTTEGTIEIPVVANFEKGLDGAIVAKDLFMRARMANDEFNG